MHLQTKKELCTSRLLGVKSTLHTETDANECTATSHSWVVKIHKCA